MRITLLINTVTNSEALVNNQFELTSLNKNSRLLYLLLNSTLLFFSTNMTFGLFFSTFNN